MALVERPRLRHSSEIDVLSASEVRTLVRKTSTEHSADPHRCVHRPAHGRAARAALGRGRFRRRDDPRRAQLDDRWREQPEVGQARSVPMVRDVATALARLGEREHFDGEGELCSPASWAGTRTPKTYAPVQGRPRRGGAASTCASTICATLWHPRGRAGRVDPRAKEWMGHANVKTTMRYLHYKSKADAAQRLAGRSRKTTQLRHTRSRWQREQGHEKKLLPVSDDLFATSSWRPWTPPTKAKIDRSVRLAQNRSRATFGPFNDVSDPPFYQPATLPSRHGSGSPSASFCTTARPYTARRSDPSPSRRSAACTRSSS